MLLYVYSLITEILSHIRRYTELVHGMRAFSKIMWSLGLSLLVLSTPLAASAQIPIGCHAITPAERAALLLREAAVPTTGIFCDTDLPLLFGSCTNDPLPILLAKYTPGSQSSREGNRGITRLNAEFACRLSRYLTAFPATTIVSAYRSPETQRILWEEALRKYGTEAEARKWVPHQEALATTPASLQISPM